MGSAPKLMNLDHDIEAGSFLLSALPISGVRGRVTPVSSHYANLVGATNLSAASADRTIQAVIEYYSERGLSFGWRVGPASAPKDLGKRLPAAGFQRLDNLIGLRCDRLAIETPIVPGLTIRKASAADFSRINALETGALPHYAAWVLIFRMLLSIIILMNR